MTITYIISDIDKALAFEWIAVGLRKKLYDIRFVLLNPADSDLEQFLLHKNIPVKRIKLTGKKDYPFAFLKLFFYLLLNRPKVVHCHLRDANLLGITTSFLVGIKNRIYSRHQSNFNHRFASKGVKYDKFVNLLATKIVSISPNVTTVLKELENVPSSKIVLVPHGFDFSVWLYIATERINSLRVKYKIPTEKKIIGCISRYEFLKGFEYLIPAFGELRKQHENLHFVFANAKGNDQEQIKMLLKKQLPSDSYTEIIFESDLAALYSVFDLYVHVPYDETVEAFGQTYVEALVAGIPSVFTLSGIAPDFIKDEQNALVVPFKNSEAITTACLRLLEDEVLRTKLIENGKQSVKKFELATFIANLDGLYQSL